MLPFFGIGLSYDQLFLRQYSQTTVETTKETYAHKTERLIRQKFGQEAGQALELCKKESGCRYDAVNPTSGAAGIGQALPPSKMKCNLTAQDIQCQVEWFYAYVKARYNNASIALMNWDMNKLTYGQGSY